MSWPKYNEISCDEFNQHTGQLSIWREVDECAWLKKLNVQIENVSQFRGHILQRLHLKTKCITTARHGCPISKAISNAPKNYSLLFLDFKDPKLGSSCNEWPRSTLSNESIGILEKDDSNLKKASGPEPNIFITEINRRSYVMAAVKVARRQDQCFVMQVEGRKQLAIQIGNSP